MYCESGIGSWVAQVVRELKRRRVAAATWQAVDFRIELRAYAAGRQVLLIHQEEWLRASWLALLEGHHHGAAAVGGIAIMLRWLPPV